MNTLHNNAINAYAKFLDAGTSYKDAMQAVAKSLGGTPCPTLLAGLAKVHAAKYECNYTWNASGNAVFYNGAESTRETRHESARKSWERNVMVWFKAPKAPSKPKSMRISPAMREAAMAFLGEFDGDSLQAQITAAVALLNALK